MLNIFEIKDIKDVEHGVSVVIKEAVINISSSEDYYFFLDTCYAEMTEIIDKLKYDISMTKGNFEYKVEDFYYNSIANHNKFIDNMLIEYGDELLPFEIELLREF